MNLAEELERHTTIAQVELRAASRAVFNPDEFERHMKLHQAALAEAKRIVAILQQGIAA